MKEAPKPRETTYGESHHGLGFDEMWLALIGHVLFLGLGLGMGWIFWGTP